MIDSPDEGQVHRSSSVLAEDLSGTRTENATAANTFSESSTTVFMTRAHHWLTAY